MSSDVAVRENGAVAEVDEAAIIAAAKGDQDVADLIIPILKVGQPLTKEVTEGEATAGEFVNGVTGQTFGNALQFIVCQGNAKGRFARNKDGRTFVAGAEPNIPAWWEDLVGEQFIGTPFAEYPDAEEVFRQRVNDGEIEWGNGPLVSTTVNFTGYVVDSEADDAQPSVPVRLSLMRTQKKTAKKLNTMVQFLRAPWDVVFELGTTREQNAKGTYYLLTARQGRKTNPEERQKALALATLLARDAVQFAGEEGLVDASDEAGAASPDAAGGLEV